MELIRQMFYTMRRKGGVGLAAPQVGFSLRLVVVEVKAQSSKSKIAPIPPTVLINPEILSSSEERVNGYEGCLSFPNVRGAVRRYRNSKVKYLDQFGKEHVVEFEGFHASVLQHEIDHLDGVLYTERMDDLESLMTLNEFEKQFGSRVSK